MFSVMWVFKVNNKAKNIRVTEFNVDAHRPHSYSRQETGTTIGDKSVETLGSKIRFLSAWSHFLPLPQKKMLIFLFLRLHRPQHLHNIELGGQVYQRINARWKYNRTILLEYQKTSFHKSVSTTFVAHCKSEIGYRFQGLGGSPQQKCWPRVKCKLQWCL